jgi:hypothetical protein
MRLRDLAKLVEQLSSGGATKWDLFNSTVLYNDGPDLVGPTNLFFTPGDVGYEDTDKDHLLRFTWAIDAVDGVVQVLFTGTPQTEESSPGSNGWGYQGFVRSGFVTTQFNIDALLIPAGWIAQIQLTANTRISYAETIKRG